VKAVPRLSSLYMYIPDNLYITWNFYEENDINTYLKAVLITASHYPFLYIIWKTGTNKFFCHFLDHQIVHRQL